MKYFIYCRKSQEAEDRQVMSLQSQADEIKKLLSSDTTIEIIDTYEEAYSAKSPGRPVFNEMIERIEKGHAQGVIAWHPDRLARNSIDGGRLIYLLDQGKLKDLRFCSYSFENSPQGKFMLGITFSNSKYYSDSLSVNVKRGMSTKVKNGWKPNLAPIGYRNCKETSTIIPDPKHFKIVRAIFDLLLTGNYTTGEIHRIVREDWGYKTPLRKTQGNVSPSRSVTYKLLANPFYAGYILWNGQLHQGKHEPIVTKAEFEKAQLILQGRTQSKVQTHSFPFSGVFTCGSCGLGVTCERKTKPSGKQYSYYHCTRVHRSPKCTQPTITGKDLEEQVQKFLKQITLPTAIFDWLSKALQENKTTLVNQNKEKEDNHKEEISSLEKQLSNLTDLKLRDVLTDDEFSTKRQALQLKLESAKEKSTNSTKQQFTLEPLEIIAKLNKYAHIWYYQSDDNTKQKILKTLCWNPQLKDKKAILEAKLPIFEIANFASCLRLRASVDYVGTNNTENDKLTEKQFKQLKDLATHPDTIELAKQAKALIETIEVDLLFGNKRTFA